MCEREIPSCKFPVRGHFIILMLIRAWLSHGVALTTADCSWNPRKTLYI